MKNNIQQSNKNKIARQGLAGFSFILFYFFFLFFFCNINSVIAVDTTPPDVNLTYSSNPVKAGTETITATYTEEVSSVPNISIDQQGSTDISNTAMTYSGGTTWTQRTGMESNDWMSITYGNGLFVAVAQGGTNRVMTSPDGITWTARTASAVKSWKSVTFGNNLFVAVSTDGSAMYSSDGTTWATSTTIPEANTWNSVTYGTVSGDPLFVAVASTGTNKVMTSPDGITWTARTAAGINSWYGVTYGNGLFVAVASDVNVMTSPDGITWTARTVTEANSWTGVIYGNGLFVAVATSGTNRVMTSPDGITWTARTAATVNDWRSVTYGNGLFVAVASSANGVMTSPDGITWTVRTTSGKSAWYGVTYGNGLFVAVAINYYRVMTSPSSAYSYNYTVNTATGGTYIDGTATVSLSSVTDLAGNPANAPTNTSFTVDTTAPTVNLTYSSNPVKAGTETITATYSETVSGTPTISINQQGSTDISNAAMSGSGTTRTYAYTVHTATGDTYIDGTATVSLSAIADPAGNTAGAPTNTSFTIDTAAPASVIVSPSADAKLNTLTSINGTATDAGGISVVGVSIKRLSDNKYFNGTDFLSDTESFLNAEGTTSWSYAILDSKWTTNTQYLIRSRATDLANNIETPSAGTNFTFDTTLPISTITAICSIGGNGCTTTGENANPQEAYSVKSIAGTASDTGGSGVSAVNISIKDTNTNKYYNGASFIDDTETYLAVTGTTTWSYDSSNVNLTINHQYQIHSKAADNATNIESPVQSLDFIFVNSPPTISNLTASQGSDGVVDILYDVTDVESASTTNSLFYKVGATLNGDITSGSSSITLSDAANFPNAGSIIIDDEIISYTSKSVNTLEGVTRGAGILSTNTTAAAHSTGADAYIYSPNATGTGIGYVAIGAGKIIAWAAETDLDEYENEAEVIKIVANDGASASMVGSLSSAGFILDTKNPITAETSLLINDSSSTVESTIPDIILKLQNVAGNPANENIYAQFSRDGGTTYFGANADGTLSGAGTMGTGFSSDPVVVGAISWPWTMQTRSETLTVKITDNYGNFATDTNTAGYNTGPEFNADYPTTGAGGLSVSQISDGNDPDFGKVKIQYSIRDADTEGDAVPYFIQPIFSYNTGSGWNIIDDASITYGDIPEGGQVIDQNSDGIRENKVSATNFYIYTAYLASSVEISSATVQFKVDTNDLEPINNTVSKTISDLAIDTQKPTVTTPITFDAGIAGVENSATITIPMPADISAVECKISDDPITQTNPITGEWTAITGDTAISWTFDSDIEIKSLKYQFRDAFLNTTTETTISTQTPVPTSSFMVQDTSNISASPPYYDIYIGWQATNAEGFSSYKLEYATSADNITYSSYTTLSSASFQDVSTNYYMDRSLDTDLFYRFRLGVVGTNGNTSVRSNAYITTKPDGVQNYGEGGGGSVATASKVENVVVAQNVDKTVTVDYKLTDASLSKKVNPSYEAYLFYNIGIALPSNALVGDTITLSDASQLKSSGYIQINNEVIRYTGKTGNTLTGIVRGTWPIDASSGRTTRTNSDVFMAFAGTPVWVLASGTSPISITDTTILTGQNGSIAWDTYSETGLAGYSFSNVGIRVLVHDNQDALSGPLSSQNDYSENGILNSLDLTAPSVSFSTASSSGAEDATPITLTLNLARAYPFNTTVDYALSGTATGGGTDYTLANGTATITAGQTTTDISIPIINDTLKELDETIIVTLSNPVNGILGVNTVYTYTIIDDDVLSAIEFVGTESSGLESVASVDISVSLSEVAGANATVDYTITGTATGVDDYTLVAGTATITAGQTTTDIFISIINDALKEDNETIILTLSNAVGATLGTNTVYTYTITDDDSLSSFGFESATGEDKEDAGTVNIPVSIPSPYPEDISVSYSVTGGTATGGSVDYLLADGNLTITAGETSANISLVIFDDDIAESTETIIITLSDPVNATLGANNVFTYSILDNEIAVSEMSGSSIKSTSAIISWTTADYTDSLVEYGTIISGEEGAYNLSKLNEDKVLEHSVYLSSLTPSTVYYYKTTSTNIDKKTTVSESTFTTTPGPVISGVSSSGITDTGATITWTTDIPASSYVNYSTDESLASPTRFGSVDLTTEHSVALTNLSSNTIYYYSVDGNDTDANTGEDTNDRVYYNFTTNADETPPTILDISTPILTSSQVAVVWKTNELADGKIMYGASSGSYENETTLISTLVINHLVTISDLEESTPYYYVIESADGNGNTAVSEEQTFTTTAVEQVVIHTGGGGGGSTIIGVAQELYNALLAENESNKAKLKNLDITPPVISDIKISNIMAFGATIGFSTDEESVAFIEYGKDKNYDFITADGNWSKTHVIRISGLIFGTDYYFKIHAMDKANNTSVSEEQNFKTKYLIENLSEMKKIENVEQFQAEIESAIESILPSLVPPFIDKPIVSDITENSATITFRTNIKSYPVASYATDSNYDITKENPYDGEISDTSEKAISHTLSLIGLKSNTKYHVMAKAYSLPQVIGKSDDFTFTTAASKIKGSVIDIKKDSFTVVWTTDEPTSSIVEYKNLKTGISLRVVDDIKNSSHSLKIENLTYGTSYEVNISGINEKGNMVESDMPINVKTSNDTAPPVITNLKVESALIVERTDRVQTIVSWQTDEPSTSTVYYEEGSGAPDESLANKQESLELTKNHVIILATLKPGTVYRFTVSSTDDANNIAMSPVRTIITPKKTESIVDVIFKNFDQAFSFLKNVR